MATSKTVFLVSNDKKKFEVLIEQASRSVVIKEMMEMMGCFESEKALDIDIPNLSGDVLQKVVEWLQGHKDDTAWTEEEAKNYKYVDEWDRRWIIQMGTEMHFQILNAANYLNIPRLLDNSCKMISTLMVGKSLEQIRETFGIVNDLSHQEEKAIETEDAWMDD